LVTGWNGDRAMIVDGFTASGWASRQKLAELGWDETTLELGSHTSWMVRLWELASVQVGTGLVFGILVTSGLIWIVLWTKRAIGSRWRPLSMLGMTLAVVGCGGQRTESVALSFSGGANQEAHFAPAQLESFRKHEVNADCPSRKALKASIETDVLNNGHIPVRIIEIKRNCGCLWADVERRLISPGESVSLKSTIFAHPARQSEAKIELITDPPSSVPVVCTIFAKPVTQFPVVVSETSLNLGKLTESELPVKVDVMEEPNSKPWLSSGRLRGDAELVALDVHPRELSASDRSYTMTVRADKLRGADGTNTIDYLDGSGNIAFSQVLRYQRDEPLRAVPALVDVLIPRQSVRPISRQVELRRCGGDVARIARAIINSPGVEWLAVNVDRDGKLTLTVRPDRCFEMLQRAEVRCNTGLALDKEIRVPVEVVRQN
jgi:hypothetical protein